MVIRVLLIFSSPFRKNYFLLLSTTIWFNFYLYQKSYINCAMIIWILLFFLFGVSIAELFKSSFFLKTLILRFCSLLTYAAQKFLLQKIPPRHQWHLLQSFSKLQRLNVYNWRISSNKSTAPIFELHLFEEKERYIFKSAKLIIEKLLWIIIITNYEFIVRLKKWFDSRWVGFCSLI